MEDLIIETARRTIQIEVETLQGLLATIGDDFKTCVQTVHQCKGRLILTGVGKSALVAQKIVATFNSTGNPALFMHAADAIHGDLGMIRPEDIVIFLSKSGETAELKVLAPLIKHLGNILIAIVAKPDCYLAKYADFLLLTPVAKEADPNNLAPTASTTAQMAIGDAIASSLAKLNKFSSADFAQFHPGGSLGKQLYLKVTDLYLNNEKPSVFVDANLNEIILEMTTKRLGATAVLSKEGRLCGIITDGDLRRMLRAKKDMNAVTAMDIMSRRSNNDKG